MQIKFFTGPQCCLCDDAKALIAQLGEGYALDIDYVNVRDDSQTYHLYGARIPVLKRMDSGDELGWPFGLDELKHFLQ